MEFVAFFIWPALAFAVIGWLGYSSIQKTSAQKAADEEAALAAARVDIHEIEQRIERLEKLMRTPARSSGRSAKTGTFLIVGAKPPHRPARPETRAALARIIPAE